MSIWKDIDGYEGLYAVSSDGEVFSYRRGRCITQDSARGYMQVTLYKNGKPHRNKVHRIVAETFIKNPYNLPFVNHKDENKRNNSIENLEWCTAKYNNAFGTRTYRSKNTQIQNAPMQRKTKRVFCIETKRLYESTKEAERETGIYHSHISRCCKGVSKRAGGFRWKYA